ncbi:MAG: prolipoprotein diacylglyceryl transferase [Hominilimicola sp.]
MNVISFPKLGITFNINPTAFSIGSKPVYWYALIILTGFLLGLLFVYRTCEKRGVKKDSVWDIALIGLIAGIVGARIYYVIFALDEFNSIGEMFAIWNGGLAIYGGIIGAAIAAFIYCRIKKLNVFNVFDVCAPGLLIGQAIGRFGNFVNAEVYGGDTASLFGMSINGAAPVHPLFLYESAWNILGLIILLLFRDRKKADGQVFCFYIFWYSLGRLFLEGMRDTAYILYVIPNILGISQLVAALLIIASAAAFVYLQLKQPKTNEA